MYPFYVGEALKHSLVDVELEEGAEDVVADDGESEVGRVLELKGLKQSGGVVYHCRFELIEGKGGGTDGGSGGGGD